MSEGVDKAVVSSAAQFAGELERPRSISFDVVGVAQPQGSKTSGFNATTQRRFVRESNKSLPGWRQLVMDQAQRHAPPAPFQGAVRLDLLFWLPLPKSAPKRRRLSHTKKPDRLKLARAVEDALKGVFYRDDSQVVAGETTKAYAYPPMRVGVRVIVTELEESVPSREGASASSPGINSESGEG